MTTGDTYRRRMRRGLLVVAGLALAACGSDDGSSGGAADTTQAAPEAEAPAATDPPPAEPTVDTAVPAGTEAAAVTEVPVDTEVPAEVDAPAGTDRVLAVPDDYATITEAVDTAQPGDLILIGPGVYNEAVDVATDDVVIRGLEREGVVLDGGFELDNGIRILGADGVAVENLTVRNYTDNGLFWISSEGYRASYVSAHRNGQYGIYAFDSVHGLVEHSYGAGSPAAGFYIGQCFPCDAAIDDVLSEHNGLGYLGTNSGGDLAIVNSTFRNNRAGIVPNSGSYELCYPQRSTSIVGNTVHSNNQPDSPAIDLAIRATGNGILAPGGIANLVERNLVFDHDEIGIGLVPFLEESPNDDLPTEDEWSTPCADARNEPVAEEIPETLLWDPYDNVVVGNVVTDSREADLGVAGGGAATGTLRNCWAGNTHASTRPAELETIAPCGGEAAAADDPAWEVEPLDLRSWLGADEQRQPSVSYEEAELPPVPDLEDMPDAATAPALPARDLPIDIDLDAIPVPEG